MPKLILFLLFPVFLLAQSFLISNLPLPKTYIQNLDPYPCDEACMQDFINKDMIFSFLAHATTKLENEEQDEYRRMHIAILNLGSYIVSDKLKIALLLPYKKIGKYAASTTNASFAYLISKNHSFELKTYKIDNEDGEDIKRALDKIKEDGFYYVIAPLTQSGADIVAQIDPDINIFFPTINKKDAHTSSPYLYYGGIDYRAQSDMLLNEAVSPLVIFYDRSSIGRNLALYEEQKFKTIPETNIYPDENATAEDNETEQISEMTPPDDDITPYLDTNELNKPYDRRVIDFSIPSRITNLERNLKDNEKIKNGSFFINTPIVKSGMIMSQLTLYDANATNILSTQINYDPLLLSMTQYNDRKNMIVANSVTIHNNILIETNSLFGNDIVYDWINYTTTVGIDYFYYEITNEAREYQIPLEENQMVYPIELLRASKSKFVKYYSYMK